MTPFFFGPAARPLFGVYVPPARGAVRNAGVVLCNPFGWEYLRTHRAFRQLATRLSAAGYHVLRFDFYGTGDSAGDAAVAAMADWLEDIGSAVEELKDTAGIRSVSLVGHRLGGLLAATVATTRDDLDRLVLWDPIIRGAAWVDELARLHPRINATPSDGRTLARASGAIDIGGFPLSSRACDQIGRSDLMTLPRLRTGAVLTIDSEASEACTRLAETLERAGSDVSRRHVRTAAAMIEADAGLSTLLPAEAIDAIVSWFQQGARAS